MAKETSLEKAREIINDVDAKMAELFVRRMRAAEIVADYKRSHGLAIYDAEREAQVIRRGSEMIDDEEIKPYYVNFMKSTMAISRAYQSKLIEGMTVAYSGTEGAFAHIASQKLFPTAKKIGFSNFDAAYKAVENGECDVAVLPLENSIGGEVGQVTDLMFSGSLYVNGILEMAITQDLLGVKGASLSDIKEVISHPQALGQCADYIEKHGFSKKEYSNTALAANYVATLGDKSVGAIASAEAAELFSLEVIDHDINETKNNTTRFAVFSRVATKPRGKDASSLLLFTVRNEAGALAKAIEVIGNHGFNMRALRSRPMKELLWQYYFYVEAEGDMLSDEGAAMLSELGEFCDRLKLIGSYDKR